MAILGIETGSFGQNTDSPGGVDSAQDFLESPKHARDVNPINASSSFDFIFTPNGGGFNCTDISGSPPGVDVYENGHYCILPNFQGYKFTLGSGYSGKTYTEFNGKPPPGGSDDGSIAFWVAPWGSDVSAIILLETICPPAKYKGTCGFGWSNATNVSDATLWARLGGSVSFQLISTDFTQIIDITPGATLTLSRGIVPVSFDSVALFGRTTSFFPQAKMTTLGDPQIQNNNGIPFNTIGIDFGPRINC